MIKPALTCIGCGSQLEQYNSSSSICRQCKMVFNTEHMLAMTSKPKLSISVRVIAVYDHVNDVGYDVQVFEEDEWRLVRCFDAYHRKTAIQFAKDLYLAKNNSHGKTGYNPTSDNPYTIIYQE